MHRPIALLLALGAALGWAGAAARAEVDAVATTPEIAALVREIGGGTVSVEAIAKPLQDPHYVDAKPSFMVDLNRADALFFNGLQLEIGWLPLLVQGARNPDLVKVNLSRGVEVRGVPTGEVSRAEGDIHPEGNPHYWMDPRNGRIMAAAIADTLAGLDPGNAEAYRERLAAFEARLAARLAGWASRMAPHRGTPVIDYHTYWVYFAAWAGLDIRGQVEAKPGIPPTASHIRSLIARIRQEGIPLVVQANYLDPRVVHFLERKTDIRALRLPATVGGAEGTGSYWDFFDTVVERIATALEQRKGG